MGFSRRVATEANSPFDVRLSTTPCVAFPYKSTNPDPEPLSIGGVKSHLARSRNGSWIESSPPCTRQSTGLQTPTLPSDRPLAESSTMPGLLYNMKGDGSARGRLPIKIGSTRPVHRTLALRAHCPKLRARWLRIPWNISVHAPTARCREEAGRNTSAPVRKAPDVCRMVCAEHQRTSRTSYNTKRADTAPHESESMQMIGDARRLKRLVCASLSSACWARSRRTSNLCRRLRASQPPSWRPRALPRVVLLHLTTPLEQHREPMFNMF